ncbi:hypothetical protein [Hyphomicrobium sp.]|uniref:hypothetical protein n=1 Tax=Hyphomicrobium sp. TaxID=82 RepID=UPI000FBEB7B2|nr:hypothetical protein [Hyphomicrobium sp.]RUP00119.1 MAG: hypothetical protein EKK30_03115 [Hyphomicrobium sp.]
MSLKEPLEEGDLEEVAAEGSPCIAEEIDTQRSIAPTELEDQYVWHKAIKYKIVGQLSPAVSAGEGARKPATYDFLVSDGTAVVLLNSICEGLGMSGRTPSQWRKWLRRLAANPPPEAPLQTFKIEKRKLAKSRGARELGTPRKATKLDH